MVSQGLSADETVQRAGIPLPSLLLPATPPFTWKYTDHQIMPAKVEAGGNAKWQPEKHDEPLVRGLIGLALQSRSSFYQMPELVEVNGHGGNTISRMIIAACKHLAKAYNLDPKVVDEEKQKLKGDRPTPTKKATAPRKRKAKEEEEESTPTPTPKKGRATPKKEKIKDEDEYGGDHCESEEGN
ncbi:hypothetical protein P7C73_g3399, partial [Tremellales sp. Uapishka_1]